MQMVIRYSMTSTQRVFVKKQTRIVNSGQFTLPDMPSVVARISQRREFPVSTVSGLKVSAFREGCIAGVNAAWPRGRRWSVHDTSWCLNCLWPRESHKALGVGKKTMKQFHLWPQRWVTDFIDGQRVNFSKCAMPLGWTHAPLLQAVHFHKPALGLSYSVHGTGPCFIYLADSQRGKDFPGLNPVSLRSWQQTHCFSRSFILDSEDPVWLIGRDSRAESFFRGALRNPPDTRVSNVDQGLDAGWTTSCDPVTCGQL